MKYTNYLFTIFLFLFLTMTVSASADDLESRYGEDFYNVPTGVRMSFQNATGKSWPNVTSAERREYLVSWLKAQDQVIDDKEEFSKKLSDQEKNLAIAARDRRMKAKAREMAEKAKQLEAKREKADRDRKIKAMKDKRKKLLNSLKQQQRARKKRVN